MRPVGDFYIECKLRIVGERKVHFLGNKPEILRACGVECRAFCRFYTVVVVQRPGRGARSFDDLPCIEPSVECFVDTRCRGSFTAARIGFGSGVVIGYDLDRTCFRIGISTRQDLVGIAGQRFLGGEIVSRSLAPDRLVIGTRDGVGLCRSEFDNLFGEVGRILIGNGDSRAVREVAIVTCSQECGQVRRGGSGFGETFCSAYGGQGCHCIGPCGFGDRLVGGVRRDAGVVGVGHRVFQHLDVGDLLVGVEPVQILLVVIVDITTPPHECYRRKGQKVFYNMLVHMVRCN